MQSVAAEEIYTIRAIFMLMGTVQKHILRMYFSCSQLTAMPVTGSVSSAHRLESICRFLHFINNSYQDTYDGPQKLFKMCPIIRHLNLKATRQTNHSHCRRTTYPSTCTCHWNCHSSGKKVQTMNQVLVICGPPQFILERRQFWSHPSFQKNTQKQQH